MENSKNQSSLRESTNNNNNNSLSNRNNNNWGAEANSDNEGWSDKDNEKNSNNNINQSTQNNNPSNINNPKNNNASNLNANNQNQTQNNQNLSFSHHSGHSSRSHSNNSNNSNNHSHSHSHSRSFDDDNSSYPGGNPMISGGGNNNLNNFNENLGGPNSIRGENLPNQQQQSSPKLDFLIIISTQIKDSLLENKILDSIISQIGGITMDFDLNFTIPEYNGCLLKIKGNEIKKKRDATQHLLEFIVKHDLDRPGGEPQKKSERIAIIIMIPNGLVSMIIGTRGKQISNLIKESKSSIVINQPIYKMAYRTVTISGDPESIANGIMLIQQIMEERYYEVNPIQFECPPLNVMTSYTTVKLILAEFIINKLTSGSGKRNWERERERDRDRDRGDHNRERERCLEFLENEYDVHTKIYQDWGNKQIDKRDLIISIKGTISNVQEAIMRLINKIKDDIRSTYDGKESYQLRVLINKVFVTKLIGAGGCMIQEIANFAKGASIKIMSNKNDEKKNNLYDIPLCIAGGFYSVQDAICIIIEQMECFRNGGPVSINKFFNLLFFYYFYRY